jgi:hypothetical protein
MFDIDPYSLVLMKNKINQQEIARYMIRGYLE